MADQPVVRIGDNSPEHVAYRLFEEVVKLEATKMPADKLNRKWILDMYAECLTTVRSPSSRLKK
jgi:hypothetical protein